MKILDGKKTAEGIEGNLKKEVAALKTQGVVPALAVILIGNDPASAVYVNNKEKACHKAGISSRIFRLTEQADENEILDLIARLNTDKKIHGILVQLPLPAHIDEQKIIEAIDPKKDVDCFHPENVGKVIIGKSDFYPCTPLGILEILKRYEIEISGKDIVVIGMSNIVGKPMLNMLVNAGATVTACHAKTHNLSEKTLRADIIISAAGHPGLITENMVKNNVVVVDVGINKNSEGKLAGDVDFEKVSRKAYAITPVPGGVGPMTVAMLMKNTILAAQQSLKSKLICN